MRKGLTSEKASRLLKQYGHNVIADQNKRPFILKFFDQFNNFLTILLLCAAAISFLIGETIDAVLIFGIVFLNALFGIYQEAKAEESIAALKKMTVMKVRVIRDGKEQEIDSRYLVVGDIVIVEEGVKVPADAFVFSNRNLEVNEAALTGESLPVAKKDGDHIFMGTVVSYGRGMIQVVSTGMNTKFGQIAGHIEKITDSKTPLQKKLDDLTRFIGVAGILISLFVFILSLGSGSSYFPAFLLAVSLAVAVVPEGLPAVMTITLAIGVSDMAKKKAIIRKLSAIEALGSITLIATDKTGTLTENKMKVKELFLDGSEKKLSRENPSPSYTLLLLNGILCSTASLVEKIDHGEFDVLGDPTEGALLYLAQDSGLIADRVRSEWEILDEKPFDSVTKLMSVRAKKKHEAYIFSKGAPESILQICDRMLVGEKEIQLTLSKIKEVEKTMQGWARRGLRVLAFAYTDESKKFLSRLNSSSEVSSSSNTKSRKNFLSSSVQENMIFLGMVAIHDPPRPEVVSSIERAKKAGIKTVMITGDNEMTAEAIGITTGLIKEGDEIMTGIQLDTFSDAELLESLPRVKIFARTTPIHKYRIVSLYQKLGEIVAVTGDGVNDAIALKQADVGVAMGLVGTDVARETADMVLTDDNFSTLVNAVEEGRNIIKNLKNAVKYLLSCNITEAAALVISLFLGLPGIFFPIQLLYINLITDGFPALALAFSPRNPHLMEESPAEELVLIAKQEKKYIGIVGLVGSILVLASYYLFLGNSSGLVAKTAAFSVLTLIQSFIFVDLWLNHHSIRKHLHELASPVFISAFLFPFITQFIILSHPLVASLFKVEQTNIFMYAQFILLSFLVLPLVKVMRRLIGS